MHDGHCCGRIFAASSIDVPWLSGILVNILDLAWCSGAEKDGRALLILYMF